MDYGICGSACSSRGVSKPCLFERFRDPALANNSRHDTSGRPEPAGYAHNKFTAYD